MNTSDSTATPTQTTRHSHLPSPEQRRKLRTRRRFKDWISRYFVGAGGISVIVALTLIFVYLFLEVLPMLLPASMKLLAQYPAPGLQTADLTPEEAERGDDATLHLGIERYRQVAFRFTGDGRVLFFQPHNGELIKEEKLGLPEGVQIVSSSIAEPRTRVVALGLSDGTALVVRHSYDLSYPEGVMQVDPYLEYPVGEEPVEVDPEGRSLERLGVQQGSSGGISLGAYTEDGRLLLVNYDASVHFMTQEVTLTRNFAELPTPETPVTGIRISMTLTDFITGDGDGSLAYYDTRNLNDIRLVDERRVADEGVEVTALEYLLGTVSIIVGTEEGSVSQWMLVRDDETNTRYFDHVRDFRSHAAPVTQIRPEFARKGFSTADAAGNVYLHFSTSGRSLLSEHVSEAPVLDLMLAPRANALITLDGTGEVFYYEVNNPHPQVSFSALFGKVQYEGYSERQFRWESSSATDEFEPKFSMMPLTLGTLKAAFFAMLMAIPISIMGAIYTAYFMTPKMRGMVKPCIEVMEALPTVILGFLAGLWLAPFVESHLPVLITMSVGLPAGMLLTAWAWRMLPADFRMRVPPGWEAAILIPVILFVGWLCVYTSPFIETALFGGDARQWLTDHDIGYDQRNALIVGLAMGFAVIPTIFSISEDAIFNVPKHLTQGSLALGATPWQTMVGVVLLTASPGIFSAIMIGFGRAVGETMIVLMASGNSPVMDWSMFQGLRTLSANIAVEMPETEVGGTHYRILFLSGLILFIMTFALNTAAEVVRQRLRKKYASL